MKPRFFLVTVLIGLQVVGVSPARSASNATGTAAWPKFRFDAANTGFNPLETILDPTNVGDLRLRWRVSVEVFRSSPVVVDGVLYIGSDSHRGLVALDAATGLFLWASQTGAITQSTPTVDAGVVYVGTGASLLAIDAATGDLTWSRDLGGQVWSSAAVDGEFLYIASGHSVVSLDKATGGARWTRAVGPIKSAPAVAGGRVFVVTTKDHVLHALDDNTGTPLWNLATGQEGGNESLASPAYADGVVYVPGIPTMYAVDAATGAVLWTADVQFIPWSSPAIANRVVYVASAFQMFAFDAGTGELLWTQDAIDGVIFSSPAVANGVVYVGGGADSAVYAFDAADGTLLWTAPTRNNAYSSPVILNGVAYFGSGDGQVQAFGL